MSNFASVNISLTKSTIEGGTLIFSSFLFHWLFWEEKLGINLFLYSCLVLVFLSFYKLPSFYKKRVILTAAITFITGILVITINSTLVKIIHILSLFITVGFIHQQKFRSILFSFSAVILNYLSLPPKFHHYLSLLSNKYSFLKKFFYYLKLSFIPIIILAVYLIIYNQANPVFAHYLKNVFSGFWSFLKNFSISHLLFVVFGFIVTAGLIIDAAFSNFLLEAEQKKTDLLQRKKSKRQESIKMLGLINENRTGIMIITLVNILLLILNIIDIQTLWFGYNVPVEFSMKDFVHTGTYLLIGSIIMSMVILLYFFKGNQNFFKKNKPLKIISYIWIMQNIILCFSVFLRNYHYIAYHGLAYKRIGVIVFLLITVVGLITLIIKIRHRKSLYFQIKSNAWSVYFVMFSLCFFNWDMIIARYNLAHQNPKDIDVDFYLELSDKALPILNANISKVEEQIQAHKQNTYWYIKNLHIDDFKKKLVQRKQNYIMENKKYSWLSYNIQDAKTMYLLDK